MPEAIFVAGQQAGLRVLALDVRSSRFGFVVSDGPNALLDFGVRSYARQAGPLQSVVRSRFLQLVDVHSPSLIVLRLAPIGSDKRNRRAQIAANTLRQSAKGRSLRLRCLRRSRVKKFFQGQGLTTKHRIASHLAERFADLTWKLPRLRKKWQREGYNMSVFDAAAAGVAHFGLA